MALWIRPRIARSLSSGGALRRPVGSIRATRLVLLHRGPEIKTGIRRLFPEDRTVHAENLSSQKQGGAFWGFSIPGEPRGDTAGVIGRVLDRLQPQRAAEARAGEQRAV